MDISILKEKIQVLLNRIEIRGKNGKKNERLNIVNAIDSYKSNFNY